MLRSTMSAADAQHTTHRIADVAGEPCIMLAPIRGYNKYPLVTLEEATQPLSNIVPGISTYVHVVKQRAGNPADGLSVDESAAIALYTMEWEPYIESVYFILNTALRTEDRQNLRPWFSYLKLICTGLSRLPSIHLTVYRGIKFESESDFSKYREGTETVWWGFSSCSMSRDISEKEQFAGQTGKRILFVIDCIKGKDISKHSYFKKEKEVLLLPATTIEVVRYEKQKHGLHFIYLREVESPYVLLEPPSSEEEIQQLKSKLIPTKNAMLLQGAGPEPDRYFNPKLSEYIARCKSHSEIILIGKRYNEDDVKIISQQVIIGKQCRALFLRESSLTSEAASVIANSLYGNKTLERLFISHNKIGLKGAQALAHALSDDNNSTLKELCVGYNGITDEGVEYLAEMLESNKTLTHLLLVSNGITDRGLRRLAEVLTNKNRTLQSLSLAWNQFRDESIGTILVNMLTNNPSLISLNLDSCKLSKTVSKQLKSVAKTKNHFELIIN